MRWVVLLIVTFMFLVMELSLQRVMALGGVRPSFVAALVVFVSLFAPRVNALWACWGIGLIIDLLSPLPHGGGRAGPLIGAHALGFTFACFLLLQIRPTLFRRQALTVSIMTVIFLLASSLVVVFLYTVHGWYPRQAEDLAWTTLSPLGELGRRLAVALYSGLLSLPLGAVLMWTLPLWGFRSATPRRPAWR